MGKSTYAREIAEILGKGEKIYERDEIKNARNGLEILARFRLGNETRACEYWRDEEEKVCRACKNGPETMENVLRTCEITGRQDRYWKRFLSGDRVSISRLSEILWKRRRVTDRVEEHGINGEGP